MKKEYLRELENEDSSVPRLHRYTAPAREEPSDEKIDREYIAEVEGRVDEIFASIGEFPKQINEIRLAIEGYDKMHKEDIDSFNKHIHEIRLNLKKFSSKEDLDGIEKQLAKGVSKVLEKSLESLEKKLEKAKKESLEAVGEKHEKYHKNITDIETKFDTLESLIGKLPKDIFEFGYQLTLALNGKTIGGTQLIDFENGNNTTVEVSSVLGGLKVKINASGGFTELAATGTVNGLNKAFTFTKQPSYIVSDGAWYKMDDSNGNIQWSWNAGSKTATIIIPPTTSIFGIQ